MQAMSDVLYLSYDIRGIQRFIFAVPNLQCIIGASSQIAEFDREVSISYQGKVVYAGGGTGMLELQSSEVEAVKQSLLKSARRIGVDLRIGSGTSFSSAKLNDRLYPFVPNSLQGYPCSMSGLLPVDQNDPTSFWATDKTVHRLVGKRREHSKTDILNHELLTPIEQALLEMGLDLSSHRLQFFRNVNIGATEKNYHQGWDELGLEKAVAGSAALGHRNRWAVIAMDGNDAGQQHQKAQSFVDQGEWDEATRHAWVRRMSVALSEATRRAFCQAVAKVIYDWLGGQPPAVSAPFVIGAMSSEKPNPEKPTLVLPIRPLILGGDDVILLCHTAHAMTFVKEMARCFAALSAEAGKVFKAEQQSELWPASGNRLTISAGVLYVKNSYPLHAAIGYAENLLGSAKGRFRQSANHNQPMPAAVDFDIVTDTLLDTPAERRRRELEFVDADLGQTVILTQRPYQLFGEGAETCLQNLEELLDGGLSEEKLPGSIAAEFMSQMTRPWADRVVFLASHSRKYPELFTTFNEENPDSPGAGWRIAKNQEGNPIERRTSLIDALILREESRRETQITTGPHVIKRGSV